MIPLLLGWTACAAPPPPDLAAALRLVPVGDLEVGAVEVDNATFRRFDPTHTSNRYARGERTRPLDFDGARQPAIVTWDEAQAFCAWATQQLGRTVRLPTEEEWVGFAGPAPPPEQAHRVANGADPATFAALVEGDAAYPQDDRLPGDDGFVGTAPVGSLAPNAHGLYDVWGNVTEWTSTPHGSDDVVHRGGAWNNGPAVMAGRNWCGRRWHYDATGLRVVVASGPE